MLKMMSDLNQDFKETNQAIGRSAAFLAAKMKLREGVGHINN